MPAASTKAVSAVSSHAKVPTPLLATKATIVVPSKTSKGVTLVIPPQKRPKLLSSPSASANQPDSHSTAVIDVDAVDDVGTANKDAENVTTLDASTVEEDPVAQLGK